MASRLFMARAAAAGAQFVDAPRVAVLCRALDGMALAIELAAARCSSLGLDGLEAGLDQRLRFLTAGGPRRRSPPLAAQRDRVELRPARRRRPRPAAHGQRVRPLVRRRRGRRRSPDATPWPSPTAWPGWPSRACCSSIAASAPATAPWSRSASSASSSSPPPTPSRRPAPATCGGAAWCCARSTRATGGRRTTSGAQRSTPWSTTSGRRWSFAESDDVRAGATADLVRGVRPRAVPPGPSDRSPTPLRAGRGGAARPGPPPSVAAPRGGRRVQPVRRIGGAGAAPGGRRPRDRARR